MIISCYKTWVEWKTIEITILCSKTMIYEGKTHYSSKHFLK